MYTWTDSKCGDKDSPPQTFLESRAQVRSILFCVKADLDAGHQLVDPARSRSDRNQLPPWAGQVEVGHPQVGHGNTNPFGRTLRMRDTFGLSGCNKTSCHINSYHVYFYTFTTQMNTLRPLSTHQMMGNSNICSLLDGFPFQQVKRSYKSNHWLPYSFALSLAAQAKLLPRHAEDFS